jgi:hypothetical protein
MGIEEHLLLDEFAVMAVDPGKATGLAGGYFKRMTTLRATLARASRRGALWAQEVGGRAGSGSAPWDQAVVIVKRWEEFLFRWNVELGRPVSSAFLVCEDFQLRQMAVDLSPVAVTNAVETLLHVRGSGPETHEQGRKVLLQSASQAKSMATNARLRQWGVWEVTRGSKDHKRDALRHAILMVNRQLG